MARSDCKKGDKQGQIRTYNPSGNRQACNNGMVEYRVRVGNDHDDLSIGALARGAKGMRNSVSGSTELGERDFYQISGNVLIHKNKDWNRRVLFHMKVDQVREEERMVERRKIESSRRHAGLRRGWLLWMIGNECCGHGEGLYI